MFFYSENVVDVVQQILRLMLTSSAGNLSFGNTVVNTTSSVTFTVSAGGNGSETITISDDSAQYSFSPNSFSLTGSGAPQSVTVTFSPNVTGSLFGNLTLSASGGDIKNISLTGSSGIYNWINNSILWGSYASDSNDSFGISVAMNSTGDRIVVGASVDEDPFGYLNQGLAYIYASSSVGWIQEKLLTGSLTTATDVFGCSVDMNSSGNCIVVGAWQDERPTGSSNTGLVYVFVSGSGGWRESAILSGSFATNTGDYFGSSVAINSAGDRIIVGAYNDEKTTGNVSIGLAYIFVSGTGGWRESAILSGSLATDTSDFFAQSVAINSAGDRVIIGCPNDEKTITTGSSGVAYIFVSGTGGWTERQILSGTFATEANDLFGQSVAMNSAGDRVIVGALWDERSSGPGGEGLGYIFVSGTDGWIQQHIVSASIAGVGSNLGASVKMNNIGDRAVIGALYQSIPGTPYPGAAYLFISGATGWTEQQIFSSSLADSSDKFGSSVTMNSTGDRILIGAYVDEKPTGNSDIGLVYIYENTFLSAPYQITLNYSASVQSIDFGNIGGEGGITTSSLVYISNETSSYTYDSTVVRAGVSVSSSITNFFYSDKSTIKMSKGLNVTSNEQTINIYYAPTTIGSHNGIVTISSSVGNKIISLTGSYRNLSYINRAVLSGSLATGSGDNFGSSISMNSAGDRIIVGVPNDERLGQSVGQNEGLAYIFVSGAGGWTQQQILSGTLATSSVDYFGYSVAMNSTGDRVIVGAWQDERAGQTSTQNDGLAYIFISGAGGWTQQQILSGTLATSSGDWFGSSVAINSTGDRVVVGASGDERANQLSTLMEGLAYVFVSGAGGWTQQHILSGTYGTSSTEQLQFGSCICMNSVGDRIIVGCPSDNRPSGSANRGLAYVFASGAGGWTQQHILSGSLATSSGDYFGYSVSINSAGDRAIIGARYDNRPSGLTGEGLAYIFVSGSGGWTEQHILSGTLATGLSSSDDQFGYSVVMNSTGDRVLVGAWRDERSGQSQTLNEGLAYIFVSGTNGWRQQHIISGTFATGSNDYFGNAVAMNSVGDRIVVGALQDERISGAPGEGLAYIFNRE